ncbi:MAG TPA: cold shock domain-containing protein [Pirellulales bacterium]|nr:cold shock domain-containing protein [Pirellulales bacterium]
MKGKIISLLPAKQIGFIRNPDHVPGQRNCDVLFHASHVKGTHFDSLSIGHEVEYELGEPREKGPRASAVYPI